MKFKKLMALALSATMICSLLTGCGSDTADSVTEEDSTGEESNSVRILTNVTGGKDDEEMVLFIEALESATGLEIEMEKPASDYDNVLMQKIQGGEEYDLIYLTANVYANLVDQGALLDITEKIKASEILTNNVEQSEWDDITIDGKIYAGFNKRELYRVVGLNRVHLEQAGVDYTQIEPTLDGYYEVFNKLKNTITTENYYPLNIVLSDAYDIQPWMAVNGLKSGVVLDSDGETYVPYSTDESAEVWTWLSKLYKEDILNPSSFVDKTGDLRAKQGAASQQSSVAVDWLAWGGIHNANALNEGIDTSEYEIVSLPGVATPSGDYMLTKGGASLFAVPANANNVDGAIKVLEYFATQEGGELLSIGIEGHDYNKNGDVYELTEIGKKHANDHGAPTPIYKDFVHPVGYNPGVEEGLELSQYATIDRIIPNEADYKEIVGKWGIQIVKGDISVEEGLASMREELVSRGVTTK